MDLITVAIPVYNSAKTIERALLSVIGQSYKDIEILIVDDRGTDNSMELAENILHSSSPFRYKVVRHSRNQGAGGTRNSSIENAKGKYIFFLDSDDAITKDCIADLYSCILNTDYDFIASSFSIVSLSGDHTNKYYPREGVVTSSDLLADWDGQPMRLNYPLWNKLYSIDFLRKSAIKCISHHLNEDAWFTFQVLLKMRKGYVINNLTYLYYETEGSTTDYGSYTAEKKKRMLDQYIEIDSLCKAAVLEVNDFKLRKALVNYVMSESMRFCNIAFILLSSEGPRNSFFARNLSRLVSVARSSEFRNFISQTLRYPLSPPLARSFKDRLYSQLCRSSFGFKLTTVLLFGLYSRKKYGA